MNMSLPMCLCFWSSKSLALPQSNSFDSRKKKLLDFVFSTWQYPHICLVFEVQTETCKTIWRTWVDKVKALPLVLMPLGTQRLFPYELVTRSPLHVGFSPPNLAVFYSSTWQNTVGDKGSILKIINRSKQLLSVIKYQNPFSLKSWITENNHNVRLFKHHWKGSYQVLWITNTVKN